MVRKLFQIGCLVVMAAALSLAACSSPAAKATAKPFNADQTHSVARTAHTVEKLWPLLYGL